MANHESPKNSKRKGTKAALAASFAALLLCGATLVGTTFAWFTDSATTGNNVIQAGNLDMEVRAWDPNSGQQDYTPLPSIEDNSTAVTLFDSKSTNPTANSNSSDTLWEPGKTQIVYFNIKNNGNLHYKYQVALDTKDVGKADGGTEATLSEVMQYKIVPGVKPDSSGTMKNMVEGWNDQRALPAQEVEAGKHVVSDYNIPIAPQGENSFALMIHMKESATNEYMNDMVNFDLEFIATQNTVESDSFDKNYDAGAVLPQVYANDLNSFTSALTAGTPVQLTADVDAGNTPGSKFSITENTWIDGGNKKITSSDPTDTPYNSRVFDMDNQTHTLLNITNATVTGQTTSGQPGYLYRGISLFRNTNPVLNLSNSTVEVGHYAVNVASENTNAKIDVTDSTLKGYCAFQTHSAGTTLNATDSHFIGLNQWSGTHNDFSTIVVNSQATNSKLTFTDCVIEATEQGDAKETFISLRTDCSIVLNGCTFKKNGEEISKQTIIDDIKNGTNHYVKYSNNPNTSIIIDGVQCNPNFQ